MKRLATKVSRQTLRIELDAGDIRSLLRARTDVPPTEKVRVRVPGGGDWSNLDLDIGTDANVVVEWEEVL